MQGMGWGWVKSDQQGLGDGVVGEWDKVRPGDVWQCSFNYQNIKLPALSLLSESHHYPCPIIIVRIPSPSLPYHYCQNPITIPALSLLSESHHHPCPIIIVRFPSPSLPYHYCQNPITIPALSLLSESHHHPYPNNHFYHLNIHYNINKIRFSDSHHWSQEYTKSHHSKRISKMWGNSELWN